MIVSTPAPVAPRVVFQGRQDSLPLEMVAAEFCAVREVGALNIMGAEGLGKTTALAHLAAVLPDAERIVFLDEPPLESALVAAEKTLVVFTSCEHDPVPKVQSVRLAAWSRDELIEYLLARHSALCRLVMKRLSAATHEVCQSPVFWVTVLDAMAEDDGLESLEQAIERCVAERFRDPDLLEKARWSCLARALQLPDAPELEQELEGTLSRDSLLFVRAKPVQQYLVREQARHGLLSKRRADVLAARWPANLIDEVALETTAKSDATRVLRQSLKGKDSRLYATAASLLARIDPSWRPEKSRHQNGLKGASLRFVNWQGCDLSAFRFLEVDLSGADLTRAVLSKTGFDRCTLSEALLTGARVRQTVFHECDLQEADFSEADCVHSKFEGACLYRIVASRATFDRVKFIGSDCGEVDFRQARCRESLFDTVELSHADFSRADLTNADMSEADLRTVELSGACLVRAKLRKINIEDVEWSSVDLANADLCEAMCTGSVLHTAVLRGAVLRHARLGEVHWERADLRDADLREVTFHLGSSRSGLVFSPHAGEGSRTGFYTDESLEQYFQSPEEIRKANLRGSDLRGAKVDGADFYLVDLRDALLEPEQLQQAQRTGAILSRE